MKHSDYLKKKKIRETRKKIISVISAIVVFITTYALVLPAITLDVSKASQEPGIAYEQMQFKATAAAASVTAADSTVEEAQVEEPAAEEPEEEPAEEIKEEEPAETPEEEASAVSAEEEEEEEPEEEAPAEPEQEEAPAQEAPEVQEDKSEADSADEKTSEPAPEKAEDADTEKAAEDAAVDQSGTAVTDAAAAATTAETAAEFKIPELDALDFDDILTGKTNFYYYHVENAEEAEELSSDSIDDWKKVGSDTVLAPEDFVRVYLSYEIPAGALNETNAVARYKLPAGLELSDKQIEAINKYENGIAASMSGSDQDKYLGAEAIEGSRTPDEKADDEYISATVKVKKTDNDRQELVFTFIPYTVEKNQISYDDKGEVKSKGKEVKGFFIFDLKTAQIDFDSTKIETIEKEDGTTEEVQYSEAKVVFADKDSNWIERALTLATPVEKDEAQTAEPKTLTSEGPDYIVTVSYTDEAQIPDNSELTVREIEKNTEEYASYLEQAKGAVDDETKSVNEARFFDITIMADGEKVEPQAPVSVQINFAGIEQTNTDDTQLLHYKDSEEVEVMDQAEFSKSEEKAVDTVQFQAEGFSVYGIVGTEIIEDTFLTADGQTYKITVTYGPEAEIPAGSKLKVEEILPGTAEYDSYNEQAISELSASTESTETFAVDIEDADSYEAQIVSLPDEAEVSFARYFDISIISDGQEIEPKAAVEVKIEYAEPVELADDEELQIVHFADDGIEVITPEINGNEIVFEQDSFSVTATVTTTVSNGRGYALLVQYNGKYYEVMYDGSLTEVTSSGNNAYTVSMAEQWTYYNSRVYVTKNTGTEYIDPANTNGISTTNRTLTRASSGNGYYIYNGSSYLGVTTDSLGNPVLSGQNSSSNAAVFYFASLTSSATGRTTDHIDIGVTASARVSVPLAYGTYYYADGSEAMTVQIGQYVSATGVNTSVPISEADLMSATISSYTKSSDGTRTPDNSFIIDEYTSSTGQSGISQVRIGGTFPVGSVTLSRQGSRGNVEQYITSDNQIYYEVDVTKPVELTLQDSNGNILYQKDVNGNLVPLTVSVNVTLTSNFSYWDDDNDCPGIRSFPTSGTVSGGMDFVLGTTDETDATLAAIEIIKYVVDEDGQPISLKNDTNFTFDIYQNADGDVTAPTAWSGAYTGTISHNGYTRAVQGRTVTVGTSGMGLAYDYSVDQGLVYIVESTPPATITDADGNELTYQGTHITTEYAWRDDDGQLHDNINQDDTLTAIPDVVGDYYSTTHAGNLHNTFLEFYVYNVYVPNTTEVSVTKAWSNIDGTTAAPAGASVVFELYADGATTGKTITLDGTVDTNGETAAWVATFEDLPIQNDSGEDIVYTVKESTGFTGYTVSYGAGSDAASNGGTITNTEEPTTANAAKAWANADGTTTAPDGASVIFTLYKNGNATEYTVTLDGTADAAPSQTTTPVGYESEAWKATFVNLPQYTYAADTTPVENNYTIAETGTYPGYTPSTADPVASGSTITNTQGSTENYVTKAWLNADGSTTPPTGATVEFTLYADGAATQHKVTLDGTADTRPTGTAGYESEPWTATFINLPKYKTGTTTEIAYSFVETSGYAGYTPSTTEQVGSGSTITNTQDDTSAHATKAWSNADGSTTPPEGASVVFTLFADGTATSYTVTLDGEAETAPEVTGGYESEPWTATFVKLPKYQTGTTNEIVYTIAETTAYPGYTASTTDPVASGETITNTQESTEANALKAWKNADGSTTPPEGASVVFTLYADGTATSYTVTLDGEAETTPEVTGGYESEAWTATFVRLPKYQTGTTNEIVYTIAETTTYPGYTASTTAPVASGETITNTEDVTKVTLIKNDSTDSSKYLAGAVFTLTKKNASGTYESYNYKTSEDGTETSSTVTSVGNASGVTMYNLVSGDYRLTETSAPDGYIILTSSIDFTVNATTGTVTLADGTPASVTIDDGVISITVPNTPGQALPNTGGSGTLPYTLGGLMLIIASALMYGFRMRRRERRLN